MLVMSLIWLILLGLLYLIAYRRYKTHQWSFTIHSKVLLVFEPVGLYLYDHVKDRFGFSPYKTKLFQLYGPHHFEERYDYFMVERMAIAYISLLSFGILALLLTLFQSDTSLQLDKPDFQSGSQMVNYHYVLEADQETRQGVLTIDLPTVAPRASEVRAYMEGVMASVEDDLCANELGPYTTYSDLRCPDSVGLVSIEWTSQDRNYLLDSGRIRDLKLEAPTPVVLSARYSFDTKDIVKDYELTLCPMPLTLDKDYLESQLRQEILEEATDTQVVLPTELREATIHWDGDTKWLKPWKLLPIGLFCALLFFFLKAKTLDEHMVKRKEEILIHLPNLMNKLALLIQAGMTFNKAFHKVVEDYRRQKSHWGIRYELYEEMLITVNDIARGTPELKAYELFARRIACKEVYRFITIVTQNIKKGNHMLSNALMELSYTVWEQRAHRAKVKGERASTKMVLPMTIMLVVVMLIILTPAVLTLRF